MPSNYTLLNHDKNRKARAHNMNVVKPLPNPSHMLLPCKEKCHSLGAIIFFMTFATLQDHVPLRKTNMVLMVDSEPHR